jgi:hypothetical protein
MDDFCKANNGTGMSGVLNLCKNLSTILILKITFLNVPDRVETVAFINSFNPRPEPTALFTPIFSKTKVWMGKLSRKEQYFFKFVPKYVVKFSRWMTLPKIHNEATGVE